MTQRHLYRSRDNRIIAGVAAGIAKYFDIDPVIVRLIFVVLTLGHGAGFLAYIIGWIIIPEEPSSLTEEQSTSVTSPKKTTTLAAAAPEDKEKSSSPNQGNDQGRITTGAVLVLLGGLFLLQNIFGQFFWRNFWPLVLVILGAALILRSIRKGEK